MIETINNLLGIETNAELLGILSTIFAIIAALYAFVRWVYKPRKATPDFIMRDLHIDDEMYGLLDEEIQVPDRIASMDGTMLLFTLESFSKIPLWIQNIYVRVIEVEPFKLTTFPYYGEGAPGPEPILGYVELKAKPGLYRINTSLKSKVGLGIDKDEFKIKVYSEKGYRYKATIEVQWTDTRRKGREGRFSFDDSVSIEFPELVDWHSLLEGADTVKCLSYDLFPMLESELGEIETDLKFCTILVATEQSPEEQESVQWIKEDKANNFSIGLLTRKEQIQFSEIVGEVIMQRPRNILLIDDHVLILQDDENLFHGEIIQDQDLIKKVKHLFSTFEKRD